MFTEVSSFVRHGVAHRPTVPNLLASVSDRLKNADSLNVLVLYEYHFSPVIKIEFASFPVHDEDINLDFYGTPGCSVFSKPLVSLVVYRKRLVTRACFPPFKTIRETSRRKTCNLLGGLTLKILSTFFGIYVSSLQIDISWPPASGKSAPAQVMPPPVCTMAPRWQRVHAKQFFPVKVGKNFPLLRLRFGGRHNENSQHRWSEAAE